MVEYTAEGADAGSRLGAVGASFGLAVAGFVVPFALALVVGVVLAQYGVVLSAAANPMVAYPVATLIQTAGFALTVAGFLWLTDTAARDLIPVRTPTLRELGIVVVGLVALLVALVGVSALYSRLDVATAQNQIVEVGQTTPRLMLYMIPLAVLAIGPGEELLFRGAIQGVLRRAYAPVPAVLLASVFFAMAHFTALQTATTLGAKAATITAIFVLSIVLGAVYEYTDNLVVPALVHGLYDVVIFAAVYLQVTGI